MVRSNGEENRITMATGGFKNPPSFGPSDNYVNWKNEVAVWRLVTDLEKKKMGLAVTLCLTGQAKSIALEMDVAEELNVDDGLDKLIEKLDSVFMTDDVDLAYAAYSDFDSYKFVSSPEVSMNDFIIEFDRRYNLCKKHKMELPDAVLSFKLLDSANLSARDRRLVLTAASDLKYATMKSSLKRIFGDSRTACDSDNSGATGISVKQESAFYTKNTRYTRYNQKKYPSPSPRVDSTQPLPGTNPLDRKGNRSQCSICRSTYHWVKDCPHKVETVKVTEDSTEENCNLTLFTKENAAEVFLSESLGCAIIDTACTPSLW